LLLGLAKVSYEQSIKPGRNLELKATYHGSSLTGGVGYKFLIKPTLLGSGKKKTNVLQGAYLKPEFFLGSELTSVRTGDGLESKKKIKANSGVLLNIGTQLMIGDFIIDTYIGSGYGIGESYRGYIIVDNNKVLNAGINIGFAF